MYIILSIPKFKPFALKPLAAKPFAATLLPLAGLPLTEGHLYQVTCSQIGHLQQKMTLAAITSSDHLQRNSPLAA